MQELGIKLTAQGATTVQGELRNVEAGLQRFAVANGQLGSSAKLTAGQMAALSNQIQDFGIQVQSGGSITTAFAQQFSQLSAQFGGMKGALAALGSLITPTTVGLGALAAVVGGIGAAFMAGAKESSELRGALALTGNMAGLTAGQFSTMAKSIADSSKTGIGDAKEALQALIATGRLSSESLGSTATAVAALSKATGQGADEIAKKFAGMIDDVAGGALELNKQYNFLTADQYKYIKSLQDAGESQKALTAAMEAFTPRANAHAESIGTIERAWDEAKKAVAGYWDAAKGIGRDSTTDRIAALKSRIETARAGIGGLAFNGPNLQAELAALEKAAGYEAQSAYWAGVHAEKNKAGIQWLQEGDKYLSRQAQFEKEIAAAKAQAAKADIGPAELGKRLDAIREKYKDLNKEADKAQGELEKQIEAGIELAARLFEQSGGLAPDFAEKWESLAAAFGGSAANAEVLLKAQAALLAQQPAMKAAAEEQANAMKASLKAAQDEFDSLQSAQKKMEEAANHSLATALDRVKSMQDEKSAADLAAGSSISLAEAVERVSLARLREKLATEQSIGGSQDVINAMKAEIAAREQLIGMIGSRDLTAAWKQANEDAAAASRAAWDSVAAGFSSAMMDGIKGIKRYLVDQFKNLVIRVPIQSAISGLGGVGGSAGGLGGLSNALSIGNLFSNGGAFAGAGAALFGNSAAYGAALGTTSIGAGSQAAMLAAQTDIFGSAGLAATAQAAGSSLVSSLAAAAPYVAAVVALAAMVSKKETPHVGGYSLAGSDGSLTNITAQQGGIANATSQAATDALAATLAKSLNSTAETFGKTAGFSVRSVFESDSNDPSWGLFHLLQGGVKQSGSFDALGTLNKDPSAGFAEYAGMAAESVRTAIESMDLPKWASSVLDALGATPDVQKLADAVSTVNSMQTAIIGLQDSFRPLGGMFATIAGLSSDAVFSLGQLSGGLDALSNNLGTYFTNFYSEAEQSSMRMSALGDTLKAVGLSVPASRDAFRALVEAQDLNTESGQRAYAALIGVSGAFADLVPAVEAVSQSVEVAATTATKAANVIGRNGQSYNGEAFAAVQSTITPDQLSAYTNQYLGARFPDQQVVDQFWVDWANNPTTQGALANDLTMSQMDLAAGAKQVAADYKAQQGSDNMSTAGDTAWADLQKQQLDASKALIDSLDSLEASLSDYLTSLTQGDLSTLSPEQKYAEAKASFDSISRQAAAGDGAAAEQLQSVSEMLLRASRAYNGSAAGYAGDFGAVVKALQDSNARLQAIEEATRASVGVQSSGLGQLVTATNTGNSLADRMARVAELERQSGQ